MPHDPVKVADTVAWLNKAWNDLRGAQIDVDACPPLQEDALYHCQQAVEKALKAFLTWHNILFRKTHDLSELGQQCVDIDDSLEPLCRSAERLSVFFWMFRYPGIPDTPSLEEARESIVLAKAIYQAVCDRLPVQSQH